LGTQVFAQRWERELRRFRDELGKLREDLKTQPAIENSGKDDSYRMATQIDLAVSRFLRIKEQTEELLGV
jgi:hypothetical protein